MSKHGRTPSDDPVDPVGIIDHEIHRLWKQFRHTNVSSSSALLKIDLLLEQRHDLTTSQGEMLNPLDVASASEWGEAQL